MRHRSTLHVHEIGVAGEDVAAHRIRHEGVARGQHRAVPVGQFPPVNQRVAHRTQLRCGYVVFDHDRWEEDAGVLGAQRTCRADADQLPNRLSAVALDLHQRPGQRGRRAHLADSGDQHAGAGG